MTLPVPKSSELPDPDSELQSFLTRTAKQRSAAPILMAFFSCLKLPIPISFTEWRTHSRQLIRTARRHMDVPYQVVDLGKAACGHGRQKMALRNAVNRKRVP